MLPQSSQQLQGFSCESQGIPQQDFHHSLNSLKLLVAGAMSAVVSRTFVAPLERVKMELVCDEGSLIVP
jgi:hypothetical protein